MKRVIILLSVAFISIGMQAVPAKPEVLRHLLETGDTARYNEMLQHQRAISMRVSDVQAKRAARRVASQTEQAIDLNIAPKGLVILVNFANLSMTTSFNELNQMINGDNYTRKYKSGNTTYTASGSARQYFIDQSWGQYQPQFDVVGPYTISRNYNYYGQNDSRGNDKNPDEMIIEACQAADAAGVDFTQYDNNNDGDIDFVYVIYAGEGEADGGAANTVWPHSYWIKDGYEEYVQVDGKYINTYACGNELEAGTSIHTGIGTFCHEFSHVLGLPDLYDTESENANTMKDWDIMDAGSYNNDSNTPPAYSAYERFFLGWMTPTQISGNKNVTLLPLNSGRGAALIASSTHNLVGNNPNPTTFYMLENREKTGWDEYLPGNGMIITKIQYNYTTWYNNTVNNSANNLGVNILEAKSNSTENGKATDAFPSGATSYTGITGNSIKNIALANKDITFTLNNGGSAVVIGTIPTALETINAPQGVVSKRIIDGEVVIVRDGVVYGVDGVRR